MVGGANRQETWLAPSTASRISFPGPAALTHAPPAGRPLADEHAFAAAVIVFERHVAT